MLRQQGLEPFVLTESDTAATAKELIAALPYPVCPSCRRVLLPVAVKAKKEMEESLEARGFQVLRLDIYDSVSECEQFILFKPRHPNMYR
jgi:uroporphyrinogen-III synthase